MCQLCCYCQAAIINRTSIHSFIRCGSFSALIDSQLGGDHEDLFMFSVEIGIAFGKR